MQPKHSMETQDTEKYNIQNTRNAAEDKNGKTQGGESSKSKMIEEVLKKIRSVSEILEKWVTVTSDIFPSRCSSNPGFPVKWCSSLKDQLCCRHTFRGVGTGLSKNLL